MKPGASQIIVCRIYCPAAIILLFMISSQLTACSLIKNRTLARTDSLLLKKEQYIAEVTIKHKQTEVLNSAHSDSLKDSYWIRIIPEGEFTYSPGKGFTGKGKSLQIRGNKENWYSAVASAEKLSTLASDSTSNRSLQSREKVKTKMTEKAQGKAMSWGIALGVILVLTVVFIFRKSVFAGRRLEITKCDIQ
ncbi:hypothetical protein [Desertivirga xinjiangensis]|uniref:hypothetical protein n=1 Tax=Desertivirga xinjiangensis TaxID=539206 RepID=UPI0021098A4E|nr:hypothetical protein [Pedobacter xinjiangensis]